MALGLRLRMALLLGVVVILVSTTLVGLSLFAGTQEVRAAAEANQDQAAGAVADAVAVHIDAMDQTLTGTADTLARTGVPDSADEEGAVIMDSLVATRHQFDAVHIIEEDMERLSRPMGAQVPALAFSTPEAHTPRMDPQSGTLLMVVPIRDDAQCCRLVGVVNGQAIEERLIGGTQGLGQGTEGMVRIRPDGGEDVALATTPRWSQVIGESDGTPTEAGDRADHRVTTMRAEGPSGVETVLVVPETQTTALLAGLVRSTVPSSLLLVAIGLMIGVVAANRILEPLRGLQTASGRMRDGDLGVRARPSGAPEFTRLAEDFNRMADSVQEDRQRLVRFQHGLEDEVARRTAALEAKNEEMERFFYGVSHDMKSPVVAMNNYAQLAVQRMEADDTSGAVEAMAVVGSSGQRLRDLIEELLLFSEVLEATPARERFDVRPLVRAVVDQVKSQGVGDAASIRAEGGAMEVVTDPGRLRHIMENLVENAVRYGHRDGRTTVHITWRPLTQGWCMEVVDEGPGIPRERRDRLFQPFAQHARRGGHTGGAGLGLSIVKRMVDSLGARLELSTSSTGTRFSIRFPEHPP